MKHHLESGEETDTEVASLADTLVQRLGIEDALRVCRENSWDGVTQEIQHRLDKGVSH